MKAEFRIGNNNFSLETCRWKIVAFREKTHGTEFPLSRTVPSKMPTDRLHQCGAVLGDHIYLFGGVKKERKENSEIEANEKRFSAINLKTERWHNLKIESNPPSRDSHKMTIMKEELFMFGGSDDNNYFNDLCSFNTFSNEWRVIETTGNESPCARDPMIFTCVRNEFLLVIGGICFANSVENIYLEDAYLLQNNTWSQYQLANYPEGLILAECVSIGNRIFSFGGMNHNTQQHSSTLYELIVDTENKVVTFKQVELAIQVFPPGRINHAMLTINNQYFMLIGGSTAKGAFLRDIWMFDLIANKWSLIEPTNGPLPRLHSHTAIMYNNKIYLMGGINKLYIPNTEVVAIEFANQEIFRSEICENCVSIMEKKETEHKKYPKEMGISSGFLYNLALEIKFPFQAIMMIYKASTAFNPTYFRISVEKTLSSFNYIKIEWDGTNSFTPKIFNQFINHQFENLQQEEPFKKIRELTEYMKLGALRLGKTFLLVTSSQSHRFVYLLSAESRISPHFDESYIYYCYVENLELLRIETEEGIKQRQFILNVLRTHVPLDAELILETKNKSLLIVFEPKIVMMNGKDYINELESTEDDIKVWKNEKKVEFLEDRGYSIKEDVEISLRKWVMFYHLNSELKKNINFFINQNESPVLYFSYTEFLRKLAAKGLIHRVPLPTDTGFNLTGEIYITLSAAFLESNEGLLIYLNEKLHSRFKTEFGSLFPQHFYKTKYKRARTIFHELGAINITIQNESSELYQMNAVESSKYYILMQKIQEKCDEVRESLENLTNQPQNEMNSEDKLTKKVKI